MNIFTNSNLIENVGWTLLHSLWQIALIALVLFVLLKISRAASANFRYLVSVSALALAFVLPVTTFVNFSSDESSDFVQSENSQANYEQLKNRDFPGFENVQMSGNAGNQNDKTAATNSVGIRNLQKFFSANLPQILPYFVGLWFFGMMFCALRLVGGVWQIRVYKTREVSAPDFEWRRTFDALCEKLKITQTVALLRSDLIETPVVVGFFKPVVLIPASVFLQISPKELETIIAHELVHVRRYDALVNFAQSFVEILFFYHPCVWWISTVVRKEREFAADEAVIEILENSHIIYASALANLEEIRLAANQKTPSLAAAANGGNLMQRITKILHTKTEIKQSASAWSAGLALTIISAVLLTVFSFNQTAFVKADNIRSDKKIAVGFVSIPPLGNSPTISRNSELTIRILIEKLRGHDIPAIGFVQGSMLIDFSKTSEKNREETVYNKNVDFVRQWLANDLQIGIGNFKHVWFYNTPFDEYVAGVEKNEAITRNILKETNTPLKYFSYPFLNTGRNAEERNRFEAWLNERGLTPVKYTIDNQEWMYSFAYDAAQNKGDIGAMTQIRNEFIRYMSAMFDHYEKYSQEIFGRDIAQTLVLTPSRLVADSADDLFGMIERRGYRFVPMDEALKDEAYNTPENFYGKSGISWFERWQMARGAKLFDEPEVSRFVENTWKNRDQDIPKPPAPPAPPAPPKQSSRPAPPVPPAPPTDADDAVNAPPPVPPAPEAPAAPPAPPAPPKKNYK